MSNIPLRLTSAIGTLLAVVFGLPALSYPFGRDQALYDYVGRGIVQGLLPYADTFDHKPPLLYLVYALASLLPLPTMMGIRLVELLTLVVMGHLLARLIEPEPDTVPGGAVALALVATHYTNFDWWNSAQTEVWEALFLIAAALAARRAGSERGAALAGALAGLAVGFKPTALIVAAVVAVAVVARAEQGRRSRRLGAFTAGGVGVGLMLLLPWLIAGELRTLWEVLILYNSAHAVSASGHDAADFLTQHLEVQLVPLVASLAGLALAYKRPTLAPQGWLLLGLVGGAVLSVVAQDKYYAYHFNVILPFIVGAAAWGVMVIGARLAVRLPWLTPLRAPIGLLVSALWVALVLQAAREPRNGARPPWPEHVSRTLDYAEGRMKRDVFLGAFRSRHKSPYVTLDVDRLSRRIRSLQQPEDTMCVRVYEPGFYALTGMWCPSRFAADFPLYDDDLTFSLRKVWRKEHERALTERPPRFMVTIAAKKVDREQLEKRGYLQLEEEGRYVAYVLGEAPAAAAPTPEGG